MNDDINIKETNKFDEISSYLNSSLNTVNNCETRLNNIGSGLSGELAQCYNSNAAPVKTKIASIKSAIEKAKSHINNSVSVYVLTDDKLSDKLNEIYDDIFNDEDYETKLLYLASGEDKKLSYDEFVELVNSSTDYFNQQREKVYKDFLNKMVTATPTLIKNIGTNTFNAIVENTYFFISDEKIGTNEYKKGLNNFKNKFADEVLSNYEDLNFVPKTYTDNQDNYNKALLALSFDNNEIDEKKNIVVESLIKSDSRSEKVLNEKLKNFVDDSLDLIENTKKAFKFQKGMSAKEMYEHYYEVITGIDASFRDQQEMDESNIIVDLLEIRDQTAWYDAIRDTEAFKKFKNTYGKFNSQSVIYDENYEVYSQTAHLEFLSAIYEYDGLEGLQKVLYDYNKNSITNQGFDLDDNKLKNGIDEDAINIVLSYVSNRNVLKNLYQPVITTKNNLDIIDDNEKTSLLVFAKDLDTSDVSEEQLTKTKDNIKNAWNNYCDGNDGNNYLEDWQISAYTKILDNDKELAKKLLNFDDKEGKNRGLLDDRIMEGYAKDVARKRVSEMVPNSDDALSLLRGLVYSNAYGFGYGLTGFTDGISDAFNADGKMNKRQMEQANIMSLLAGDYSLYSNYYNKDPKLMDKFSTEYDADYIKSLKLKNLSDKEINDLINDCKNNNVPKYELEYYAGQVSYDEYMAYKGLANTSEKDLEFYAKLKDNEGVKWFSEKAFKVSNSVGNMAIPTVLNILSMATGGASTLLSSALSTASFGTLFASSYGRTKEGLLAKGETDSDYIVMNSLLHASLETLGEAAFGKILKSPKWGEALKNITAKVPGLGTIINASDDLGSYLVEHGCNQRLAKYMSNILGEVIQENGENLFGWGIDALTSYGYKNHVETPTLEDIINETWETTWMTALTTPILNGMTDISLSNVSRIVNFDGKNVSISLNDLLLFTNEETNTVDYKSLSEYLTQKGKMDSNISTREGMMQITPTKDEIDFGNTLRGEKEAYKRTLYQKDGSVWLDSKTGKPIQVLWNPTTKEFETSTGEVYKLLNSGDGLYTTDENIYHVLYGEIGKGRTAIGGHNLNNMVNDETNFVIEAYSDGKKVIVTQKLLDEGKIDTNPDGTINGNYAREAPVRNKSGDIVGYSLSKTKTDNTFFPVTWSDDDIRNAINKVAKTDPIGVRTRDGQTVHRGIVNGVEVEVYKNGRSIQTGYPTGKTGEYSPVPYEFIDLR